MKAELLDYGITALYLLETVVILLVGMKFYDWYKSRFNLSHELTENDNPAVITSLVGYFVGTVVALLGLYHGESEATSLTSDLISVASFGGLTILLMICSSFVTDKLILPKISVDDELAKGNTAVGIVEGATFLANGCILYGAMSGEGSAVTGLVFWVIGQVTLVLSAVVYNLITKFNSTDEVKNGNKAVALAKGGFILAVGYIIKTASKGDFVSWSENLTNYAIVVAFALICLPIMRLIFDLVIIRKADVCKELSEDRNVGLGLFESAIYLSTALISTTIFMS